MKGANYVMKTVENTAAETAVQSAFGFEREPTVKCGDTPHPVLSKRIGSTTFFINVYTNPEAKETLNDKILRLVERESIKSENLNLTNQFSCGTMESLQTVRLPGGSI
jgi:hypothetical protein